MSRRLGTSERAADVDGDSKEIDENGDLFAFTPARSDLSNGSVKPTEVRPPVTSENSAEITGLGGGGVVLVKHCCQGMWSCGFAL